MSKFQIGDIVVANELSNRKYAITNKRNGWKGEVSRIGDGIMTVRGIEKFRGDTFAVDQDCFDLAEEMAPIEAPDIDLFAFLY